MATTAIRNEFDARLLQSFIKAVQVMQMDRMAEHVIVHTEDDGPSFYVNKQKKSQLFVMQFRRILEPQFGNKFNADAFAKDPDKLVDFIVENRNHPFFQKLEAESTRVLDPNERSDETEDGESADKKTEEQPQQVYKNEQIEKTKEIVEKAQVEGWTPELMAAIDKEDDARMEEIRTNHPDSTEKFLGIDDKDTPTIHIPGTTTATEVSPPAVDTTPDPKIAGIIAAGTLYPGEIIYTNQNNKQPGDTHRRSGNQPRTDTDHPDALPPEDEYVEFLPKGGGTPSGPAPVGTGPLSPMPSGSIPFQRSGTATMEAPKQQEMIIPGQATRIDAPTQERYAIAERLKEARAEHAPQPNAFNRVWKVNPEQIIGHISAMPTATVPETKTEHGFNNSDIVPHEHLPIARERLKIPYRKTDAIADPGGVVRERFKGQSIKRFFQSSPMQGGQSAVARGFNRIPPRVRSALTGDFLAGMATSLVTGPAGFIPGASLWHRFSSANKGNLLGTMGRGALKTGKNLIGNALVQSFVRPLFIWLAVAAIVIIAIIFLVLFLPRLLKELSVFTPFKDYSQADAARGVGINLRIAPVPPPTTLYHEVPNGGEIHYEVTVTYTGKGTADIQIDGTVPANTDMIKDAENGWSQQNDKFTQTFNGMHSQESKKIQLFFTPEKTTDGTKEDFWIAQYVTAEMINVHNVGVIDTTSTTLQGYFDDSAKNANVPTAMLKAIARKESGVLSYTQQDVDTFSEYNWWKGRRDNASALRDNDPLIIRGYGYNTCLYVSCRAGADVRGAMQFELQTWNNVAGNLNFPEGPAMRQDLKHVVFGAGIHIRNLGEFAGARTPNDWTETVVKRVAKGYCTGSLDGNTHTAACGWKGGGKAYEEIVWDYFQSYQSAN